MPAPDMNVHTNYWSHLFGTKLFKSQKLQLDPAPLTNLLATLFIITFSGRFIVLATARTISLACCLVGQSNRLYRTVCFLVQRRSSSSARRTVGSLSSSAEEKYLSRSKEAWSGVASSPVSCWVRGRKYNS